MKAEAPLTEAEKAHPVQLALSRRLRAARKRLTKIESIQAAEKEGKELNLDQASILPNDQPSRPIPSNSLPVLRAQVT